MKKLLITLMTCCILIIALPLKAQEIILSVTGLGTSKADAIVDAQRNALRLSYGEYVSSNLETLNNQLTKNETVNLVAGTIKDYKVLSESINNFSDPPITEVLLKLRVDRGKLIAFAKSIGSDVKIEGALYGAELKLQKINKRNETVAIEHLVKKVEMLHSLFDYELEIHPPKKAPFLVPDFGSFYIYSSLNLKTNKNFTNINNAVWDTVNAVAIKSDELKKYEELNQPFFWFYIHDVAKKKQYKFGFRSAKTLQSFERIRAAIERSAARYDVYREIQSQKKLLLPFPTYFSEKYFETIQIDSFYPYNWVTKRRAGVENCYGYESSLSMMSTVLRDRVLEMQPNEDQGLNKVIRGCKNVSLVHQGDVSFSSYALDVARMYGMAQESSNNRIEVYHLEPGSFFKDRKIISPFSDRTYINLCKNRQSIAVRIPGYTRFKFGVFRPELKVFTDRDMDCKSSRKLDRLYPWSEFYPIYEYTKLDKFARGTENPHVRGVFSLLPEGFEFMNLKYEDIVDENTLSSISSYSVDPDNLIKSKSKSKSKGESL